MSDPAAGDSGPGVSRRRSRLTLLAFLLTFTAARILVFLIMDRRIPDLFLHVGGTHIHHLNYGIFLLAGVGGYLLFARPSERSADRCAVVYGVGLALTFDEFGMWLHLGGGYWQRASFDAISVATAILGLIAFAPRPGRWQPRHWTAAAVVLIVSVVFFVLLIRTLGYAGDRLAPRFERLEQQGPA